MLHPDAPEAAILDPDEYARWRHANADVEEISVFTNNSLTEAQILALFRDEWYEAQDPLEVIAIEDAEIERDIKRQKGGLDS